MVGKSPWENGGSVHLGTCVSLGYKIARIEEPCLSRAASKAVTWHNPGYSRVQCLTWNAILSLKHIKIYETALQMSTNIYKNTQKPLLRQMCPSCNKPAVAFPPYLGEAPANSWPRQRGSSSGTPAAPRRPPAWTPSQWYPHDTEVS